MNLGNVLAERFLNYADSIEAALIMERGKGSTALDSRFNLPV